jgi:hypothetical protein
MIIYLLIGVLTLILVAVYFYIDYKKRTVFDNYIDLDVSLEFTENTVHKTQSCHGLILFNIRDVRKESRALTIDNLKLHSSKLVLRSYSQISTKLPLPTHGVILSVGVKKARNTSHKNIGNHFITMSGFLMEDKNKKTAFKKKLKVNYLAPVKTINS